MKVKHNKKRNTAFLYECLIRELTKSVIAEDKKRKNIITSILKEHFSKNSILREELKQYKELCDLSNDLNSETTSRIVSLVIEKNRKLDKKKLFEEQSKTISRINKELGSEILQNFVPNYRNLANICQLFNVNVMQVSAKDRILLENKVMEDVATLNKNKENVLQPITNLTYKLFVNKFNESYGEKLLNEQKKLLANYISSFRNNGSDLKLYLNEEIERLKNVISASLETEEIKADKNMIDKTNGVLEILNEFGKKEIDQEMLSKILKIQQLAEEIKS